MEDTREVVKIPCEKCTHKRVCKYMVPMGNMKLGIESELLINGKPTCDALLDVILDCKYSSFEDIFLRDLSSTTNPSLK